jgi:hypothetical protein
MDAGTDGILHYAGKTASHSGRLSGVSEELDGRPIMGGKAGLHMESN